MDTDNNWKKAFPYENIYYETNNGILYHGDSLKILEMFSPNAVDVVFTDPPFGNDVSYGRSAMTITGDSSTLTINEFIKMRIAPINLMFIQWKTMHDVVSFIQHNGYKLDNVLVWTKENHGMSGGGGFGEKWEAILVYANDKIHYSKFGGNVFDVKRNMDMLKIHPHSKPVKLITDIMEYFKNYNIFLDPFAGSGSIGLGIQRAGKKWIMIEREEKYCEVIKKRMNEIKNITTLW